MQALNDGRTRLSVPPALKVFDMQASTALSALLLGLALVACSDEESDDTAADTANPDSGGGTDAGTDTGSPDTGADDTVEVELTFLGQVGDQPLDCNTTYEGLIAGGPFTLADLRFFVSNVTLEAADGTLVEVTPVEDGVHQGDGLALIDLEDGTGNCANATPATNAVFRGTVPAGEYTGVTFTVGVPESLNHVNPAEQTGPLAQIALHWSWMAGYKHFQLEGATTDGATVLVHLGSKACTGAPPSNYTCAQSNRPEVALTGADPLTTPIVVDLGALFAEALVADGQVFCMSEQSEVCGSLYGPLALDLASGDSTGSASVFRFAE